MTIQYKFSSSLASCQAPKESSDSDSMKVSFFKIAFHFFKSREHVRSSKLKKIKRKSNIQMANFVTSAFTFTVAFAEDLKAALLKNPDLDIAEFTKPYFGIPASLPAIVANVSQKPVEKKAPPKKGGGSSKPMCTATTAKGTQCTKCAVQDGPFCSIHLKKSGAAPVEKKEKTKKPVKVIPKHNHAPGKKNGDEACELCDSHGDITEPKATTFVMEEEEEEDDTKGDPDFALTEDDFED